MYKFVPFFLLAILIFAAGNTVIAQQNAVPLPDTFFLAKKKGLLGRLGKSISTTPIDEAPQKVENQFLMYRGKIIRSIQLVRLGFESNIYDSTIVKKDLGVRLANTFHKNSQERVIYNNLFFSEGVRLSPYLFADNLRYLRDLSYIQDARILVEFAENSNDSVDVIVLAKDVFSLGGKLKIDDRTRGRVELQDENVAGTANRIFISALYDKARTPVQDFSAELTKRNINGSFIDWTTGFSNFAPSFSSSKREVTTFYSRITKPLVTPYIPSTGALEAAYFDTNNGYSSDSLYQSDLKYRYYTIDGWFGYSLDSKRSLYENKEIRVHKFAALRSFIQRFSAIPQINKTKFDYRFSNQMGILASVNIFKQVFYKTNFIYGFGRNEDVPEGFTVSLIQGWTKTQQVKRPYTGIDFTLTNFKNQGFFTNYTFRAGTFFYRKRFEDMDLLFNVDHFTRLRKLNRQWLHRFFMSTGITTQINPVFNAPLFLNSVYGLPYFNPENISADFRSTIKLESVFYNLKKILGFRFAPFIFSDISLLKPTKANFDKSDLFTGIGGGVRTRNENLVFGTIELKGYYFPRTNGDMRGWKIEVNTNIRFKYNSTFIKRPDFVIAN